MNRPKVTPKDGGMAIGEAMARLGLSVPAVSSLAGVGLFVVMRAKRGQPIYADDLAKIYHVLGIEEKNP